MRETDQKLHRNLPIIGATEWVSIGKYHKIPAKIDTGAESSAIWASKITVTEDGTLKFVLFGKSSPLYTGRVFKRAPGTYKAGLVRSSNGQEQIRYRVYLPIKLGGKKVRILVSLADRSRNIFPILVGRRTIAGKFLVDTAQKQISDIPIELRKERALLNEEMGANPYKFYQKHMQKKGAK